MTWNTPNRRAWRAVLLLLLLVAFLGPWNFGLAHQLAQFECPPPYTRLEGDFCGWPQSGLRMGFEIARGVVFSVGPLLGGETSLARPVLTTPIILFPFVPVALTLAALWRGSGRGLGRLWPFWLLGLLAVILYLLFMAAVGSELGFPYLRYVWGAWLYVVLAAAMVVVEGVVRVAGRDAASA